MLYVVHFNTECAIVLCVGHAIVVPLHMYILQAFKETAYHFHVLIKTPVWFVSFVPSICKV